MILTAYEWQIGVSRWLMRFLAVGYFLVLITCFMNSLALVIKLSLAIGVFLQAWKTWQQHSVCHWQLNYDDENGWKIAESRASYSIEILPSTVISRGFIFLHYRSENQKFYRLIFQDALLSIPATNNYRQLIVTLKTYS